jgi:hypothetical protein
MTKGDKVRWDMFVRFLQFLTDYLPSIKTGVIAAQRTVLNGVVERLQTLAGDQSAGLGDARFTYDSKGTARENLRAMMRRIAETAHSMVYKYPGIDLKFQMPRNNSDAEILAKARAFQTEATAREADFIENEMEADFLAEFDHLIADFEHSLSTTATATTSHVEASAEIGEEIRKGMIAFRTMKGAVLNRVRDNPGKLAAFTTASHVEKIPINKPRTVKKEEQK